MELLPEVNEQLMSPQERKQSEKGILKILWCIYGPIIAKDPGWFPRNQITNIPIHRLAYMMKNFNTPDDEMMIPEFEALMYLSTVSMDQPLDQTWYTIFIHLFKKHFGEKMIQHEPDFFNDHNEPDDYELHQLDNLRRWMWQKSWSAFQAKVR